MNGFIYYFVYCVLFILASFDMVAKKNSKYLVVFFAISIFILMYAGFRTCSIDYDGYRLNYDIVFNANIFNIYESDIQMEPAYVLINLLSPNFESVIFIMAFLNILILFPFFYKYSPYPFVTLLFFSGMFLYSGVMGLVRQSLAIAICLWAMVDPKNRKFFWLILIAMTFHASAVIVCAVRFLKNEIHELKWYLIVFLLAIFSNIFLYEAFLKFVSYLPSFMEGKLNYYIIEEEGTTFGFNNAVAIRLFTFSLGFYYIKAIAKIFKIGPLILNIYFLCLIIYVGFGFLPQIAARGAIYFHYAELVIVPMIMYAAKPFARIGIFLLYSLFSLSRHITMLETHAEYYIPYTNLLVNQLKP